MNQVTFSADKENLLFIFGDQMIKYPLREGVLVSFVEGQPVVVKASTESTETTPQLKIPLVEEKAFDFVMDKKNSKGYLVGEIDVVIGMHEAEGITAEEKEVNGAVRSINFDTKSSKVYISRDNDNLAVTILPTQNGTPNG